MLFADPRYRLADGAGYTGSGALGGGRSPSIATAQADRACELADEEVTLGIGLRLALVGGVVGVLAGVAATAVYASAKSWVIVIPAEAWMGGIASAILIGAFAGLMPAVRASRMPPTVALRTV